MDAPRKRIAFSEFLEKFSGKRPALESTVSAAQVLRRLAEIEADASDYYAGLAEHSDLPWVQKFARELAGAERNHEKHFLELAGVAEAENDHSESAMEAPLSEEIIGMMSVRITQSPQSAAKTAIYLGERDAVEFAIQAEANTVGLLEKLMDHVPVPQRPHIMRVLAEEVMHKSYLERLRDKHFGPLL